MKITPHFDREEFDCKDGTSYPSEWIDSRLRPLCEALEVLREALGGHALTINSGYRTPTYNKKIKGALNSQHIQGRAADISCKKEKPEVVANLLQTLMDNRKIPLGGIGVYKTFVHYDIRGEKVLWQG